MRSLLFGLEPLKELPRKGYAQRGESLVKVKLIPARLLSLDYYFKVIKGGGWDLNPFGHQSDSPTPIGVGLYARFCTLFRV